MSFALDLKPFIALVSAPGLFKRVDGVLDLAAVRKEATTGLPAAFVYSDSETAIVAQSGAGLFEQIVTTLVGVVIVVGADGVRRGAADDALFKLENGVGTALIAAGIEGLARPVEYADARLFAVSPGRVSRLLRFRAIRRLRVERNYP